MTQSESRPQDEATIRAATLIAQALSELQSSSGSQTEGARQELRVSRQALQDLAQNLERNVAEQREQHLVLAGQLTSLAGSLDRLVVHLQGLSQLMADLLERLAESPAAAATPAAIAAETSSEPVFQPGGEGISLSLAGVPGFQALMEMQKALAALAQVDHASVERFQEGDSRILIGLSTAITATELVDTLIRETGQSIAIEESRPELARLRLKVVPRS